MNTVPTPLPLLCSCPISAQVSSSGQSSHTACIQPSPRVLLGVMEGERQGSQEPESCWRLLPRDGHREPRMSACETKDQETP